MAQSLELLLIQFLMPDNDARRQAEDQINRLAKDPQVVPALIQHLRTAKTPNVRQLAAVLLRKRITGHWTKLSPQIKLHVKQSLIESITVENSPPVRRASANVVSVVAKYAVPAGEWPDLLTFLFQCSQSLQEDHREVALILFSSLTETIGNTFRPYFADLQALLLKCMQDESSSRVRIAALKAVGSFLEFTNDGDEVVKFRDFIPSILNVSRKCIASGEEDVAILAFEIFDELIESPAPLLGDSVKSIVDFSLEVSCNQNLESSTRHQAIQIVSWLAKYKYNSLKKHKLVIPILKVMCPLLAESSDQEDDDDLAPDRAAAEVIDTLAMNLPKHVFPPVLEFASVYYQNTNPKCREASATALGVISEGCFDMMKEKLEPVLNIVLGALRDPEQMVRGAASFAIGQFAEHLQPEILSHYQIVLPCLLTAIEDASEEVKEKSHYALAAFCENMGEEIVPLLDHLMQKLMAALKSSPRNLQETFSKLITLLSVVISDILAAAHAIFQNHNDGAGKANEILDTVMNNYIKTMTEDDDKEVVAQACMSVADIMKDYGYVAIQNYLSSLVDATLLLLTEKAACQQYGEDESDIDDDDTGHDEVLMDAVSDLLPAFAKCMGSHFEPVFAKFFEPLMKFAKASRPPQDRTMVVASLAEVAQDMGPPISAYVDRLMPLVLKELGSPEATNRRNAAFCVGELCKNGGEAALKYFGDVLRKLSPLFGDSEPELAVRDNAAGATARMIVVHPELVPLNQVLPVLLRGLPLKEDQEESMAVYSCIYSLVLASNPEILPHVPDLVKIFGQVVESPVEKVEVKAIVGRTFSHLISLYGNQLQPIIGGLPPSQANVLAAFASTS
ncbi:PREDICTED: importin-4-like [Camelina sativa]|uniref:Importin-4-like n=1 Tax=Camelina sativa TaxID=90675 RepID=A0ABM0V5M7_CAMSA|nr:PREDICTED: importin-4-like [Camelina sativa]